MRGENRDYIPTRQKGVKDSTCDVSEGCAFKAKATKRQPHYRQHVGKNKTMPNMFSFMMGVYDD